MPSPDKESSSRAAQRTAFPDSHFYISSQRLVMTTRMTNENSKEKDNSQQ